MKMGRLLGINETSAAGMVASLANSVPMFGMVKDMDDRGKVDDRSYDCWKAGGWNQCCDRCIIHAQR